MTRLDDGLYALAVGLAVLAVGLGASIKPGASIAYSILAPAALVVAVVLVGLGVRRFRARNGVWINGFSPRRARWVSVAMVAFLGGLNFAAVDAGDAGDLGVVLLLALAGGVAAYLFGQWWMRVYRAEVQGGPRA